MVLEMNIYAEMQLPEKRKLYVNKSSLKSLDEAPRLFDALISFRFLTNDSYTTHGIQF